MKKIYKSLMVLAAAFILPTALSAQTTNHEKYEYDADKGIGYNKYLVSDTPNENGEYTLRVENFITGEVKQTAVPTDFLLVLDVSGSMQFDYRPRNTIVPTYIRKADNDALDDKNVLKLRLDDGQDRNRTHYGYVGTYSSGAVGATGSGGYTSITWAFNAANPVASTLNGTTYTANAGSSNRWWYYPEDQTYYRLFRYSETISGSQCYYIYFDRIDANGAKIERRYVVQNGNYITTTTTKPTNIHATNTVIFIDNMNNVGFQLYRYANRKDELNEGVKAFIDMIVEENAKDQWLDNVTKHQVGIIAFGNNQNITNLNEPTGDPNGDSKVVKIFREISSSNADSYKSWDDACTWQGSTYIYRGITGARRMFEALQQQPNMAPLNAAGGTNRNKVMVVFTDGEPTQPSGMSGYSGVRGSINLSCADGAVIKETGSGKINGIVYTINLSSNTDYVPDFLEHLSSNYKAGVVSNGKTGGGPGTTYSGSKTGDGYYMDANEIDLESAFKSIAAASTGAMSSALVAVDVMSDSFWLPFSSEDTDKVTMYTAQCIGTKEIDGEEYLAFAEPIQVSNRPALQELWVVRTREVGGETISEWVNLGADNDFDIDNRMSFTVKNDEGTETGRSIIVSGFNYADLWCGFDADENHHNTRQIEDDDPNFDYQKDGYRGFKLIFEFPFKLSPDAVGGVNVPTNDWATSGLYKADEDGNPSGNPEVHYPEPDLPVPVRLIIQKTGLLNGESANFTIQRKLRTDTAGEYVDYTTFVLTGGVSTPEVRIINLDPAYYYKVKEGNWSWAYENVSSEYYTTDPADNPIEKNPIVFKNEPEDDTPKHAEAKATNIMRTTGSTTESTD